MPVYMVDRHLPGITAEQLAGAQRAAIDTSKQFTSSGKPVRYIRSTFIPGEARCQCLFEAQNADSVKEVNNSAGLPFSRIVEAVDLTPVMLILVAVISLLSAACGSSPTAPASGNDSGATMAAVRASVEKPAILARALPAASCSNVKATVAATLQPGGTATGTISGDINGPVSAAIHTVDASGGGNGALHVRMEHHYTNASPFGTIGTEDDAVLAPLDKSAGLYRMNNRLTIVEGGGIYANATGQFHTHGTVDFTTGAIQLSLNGRVCSVS